MERWDTQDPDDSGAIAGGISVSAPGAGVSNESGAEIGSLVNAKFGTISGGAGRDGSEDPGGVGVSNSGTIETLINKWHDQRRNRRSLADVRSAAPGGAGGAGVSIGGHDRER